MENEIKIFSNPQFGEIRTTIGKDGKPLFCLSDVAKALGYKNPAKAVIDHCKGVTVLETPTNGGTQQIKFGKEGNVYRLVMKSKLPEASIFQDWVCDEVLPSIRKTGGYMVAKADETPEEIMARALMVAQETLRRKEQRLIEAQQEIAQKDAEIAQGKAEIELKDTKISEQQKVITESAPKVSYYDETLQSVNTVTTTQIAKEIGLDASKLNRKLKDAGILFKQSGQWLLRQPYCGWNLASTRTSTFTRSDGTTGTNTYTVWSQKGRRFIHALKDCDYKPREAVKLIKGENKKCLLTVKASEQLLLTSSD